MSETPGLRLWVEISPMDLDALMRMSRREGRPTRKQAAHLLHLALRQEREAGGQLRVPEIAQSDAK